ncbi:MAG: MBL fold metallo-hydrolase RNA specificity domain-containing protein, partial [Candidatus Bathyarchaeia archaeon]
VEVVTHNSGHILGSTMFHLTTPTGTVAYTGDLNCVDTLVSEAAEPLECDTLIIESTYGSPDLVLPPRHQTYKRMVEWTLRQLRDGFTPAFNVYSAGKAQEIIKMLNDFTAVPIVADGRILKVNKVYERSRIPLKADGQLESSSHNNDGGVVLVSSWRNRSPSMNGRVKPAVATGWAVKFNYKCASFPLSSHADFRQLLAYVKAVKPKKVYTCLGFSEELASAIRRRLGIDASTIPRLNEATLMEHQ